MFKKFHSALGLCLALFAQVSANGQSTWSNWDQQKAFDEAQARVKQGKDPMPGVRNCFWRYGPFSGDPYINIAYPDAGTYYWGVVFTLPKGARLHLEGDFPHARYMSLNSYDGVGAPLDAVADYLFEPMAGSVNPYISGVDRASKSRRYRIEVVGTELGKPIPWGVFQKGQTRDRIHAPAQAENGQQQLIYRIYGKDNNTDEAANGGLPVPILTLADSKVLRGRETCEVLRTGQPLVVDQAALATPRDQFFKLQEGARQRMGPTAPAVNPPLWSKSSEDMSRYAIYTGDNAVAVGTQRRQGTFYANLDNQYVRTFLHRRFGEVFVMRAKAPTVPKTLAGGGTWSDDAELRYWSWCSQQGFASGRVNACLFDEQIPTDRAGFYTLVVSRQADRPRNAIAECGVAWLPMADIGDGTGDVDMTMLTLRHMLGATSFKNAVHNVKTQESIAQDMGPYAPRGRYTTVASFETAVPCLIEKR